MKQYGWRLIPLLFFTALALFLWRGLSLNPAELPSTLLGKPLPNFQFPAKLTTKKLDSKTLRGHISLLNIWASWCAACTEEQVFLLQLAQQGVSIYGLNYKDDTQQATEWLTAWGNPYQAIGEDKEGQVALNLGVYGAPETFLIDQKGIIQYRYAGVLNQTIWQREFLPRIQQLEGTHESI